MTNAEKMGLLLNLYHTLFQAKAAGQPQHDVVIMSQGLKIPGRWFKNSATGQPTLRGYDFQVINNGKLIKLRMLEQNPDKVDAAGNLKYYSNLARQGHKIAWLIDRDGGFLGRLQDGQWHASQQRATVPAGQAQPYQPAPNTAASPPANDGIPDIPADVGIPEFVLHQFANDEEEMPYGFDQ